MSQPNIVFINCHDLGRHLNCYGHNTVNSPNLDKLAENAIVFDQHFCTAPQCSPSRAALYTGRHAHTNGMHGLAHDPFNWRMHNNEIHLAQRLKDADYATALVGFQHVTEWQEENVKRLGFDAYFAGHDAISEVGPSAARYIQNAKQPFYLEVGFIEPHRAYDRGEDDSKGVEVLPYVPDSEGARQDFAALQEIIRVMDEGFGIIYDALQASDLLDDTILIFTTDHGLAMPRAKCTLYDPGIEVAMMIHANELMGGRRIEAMTSHVDIVPTLLDMLNLPVPPNLHGKSLLPYLKGDDAAPNTEIFAEKSFHTSYEPMRGIRTDRYKLVINFERDVAINVPTDIMQSPIYPTMVDQIAQGRPHVELYDLEADPNEVNNLAGQADMATIEADLKARLLHWMESTADPLLHGPIASPYYHRAIEHLRGQA